MVPPNIQVLSNIIQCVVCRYFPIYISKCIVEIFQVVYKHVLLIRACIHSGHHNHALANSDCRDSMQDSKSLICSQIKLTPLASLSTTYLSIVQQIIIHKVIQPKQSNENVLEDNVVIIVIIWNDLDQNFLHVLSVRHALIFNVMSCK